MSDHILTDRASILQALQFDHRASIVAYLEGIANNLEQQKRGSEASLLRAQASNVAAQLDIVPGQDGIASAGQAVAIEVAARFANTSSGEILGPSTAKAAVRARFACYYVLRKRMNWTQERIGQEFGGRDASSVSHGLQRAEEIRATDEEFKLLTEELAASAVCCENCRHPLT